MTTLDVFKSRLADDRHLAELVTTSPQRSDPQISVVNAAVITHPSPTNLSSPSFSPKRRARSPEQPSRPAPNRRLRCWCRTEDPNLLERAEARLVLDASARFTPSLGLRSLDLRSP